MNQRSAARRQSFVAKAIAIVLGLSTTALHAQDGSTSSAPSSTAPSASPASPSTSPTTTASPSWGGLSRFGPSDPNPYYLGVSQAFTHDSNVFRIPDGPSDTYSSTSLLGGFDQPISRQRVFGRGSVTTNRYQDSKDLDNVSYDLSGGAALETISSISGGINVAMNRNLTAPLVTAGSPQPRRDTADTRSIDASLRYGGTSLLSLEGLVGFSRTDYSLPESAVFNSKYKTASVTLYYHPGGPLRLGVGARGTRTETPQAFLNTVTGEISGNTQKGQNFDLHADYVVSGLISTGLRLSYTKVTNSGYGADADFSGWTGNLQLSWRPTAKLGFNLIASRDAGYNTTPYTTYTVVQTGNTLSLAPVTGLYQNNQVTGSLAAGVSYAATAKIGVNAGVRYSRAKIAGRAGSDPSNALDAITTDISKTAYIGANYDVWRGLSAACNLSYETRDVSGEVGFSYSAKTVSCSAQYFWR